MWTRTWAGPNERMGRVRRGHGPGLTRAWTGPNEDRDWAVKPRTIHGLLRRPLSSARCGRAACRPSIVTWHRSASLTMHQHHSLPLIVTHRRPKSSDSLSLIISHYLSLSLIVTHCHSLSLILTHCHSLPLIVTHCHSLLLSVTHCHSLSVI